MYVNSKAIFTDRIYSLYMRFTFLSVLFLSTSLTFAQTSLQQINLEHGTYAVGFHHYMAIDSTRTYSQYYEFTNEKVARPMHISLWYPVERPDKLINPLRIMDYFEILKEEEEWAHLPNDQILNWFYYANSPENQKHLLELTSAYAHSNFGQGQYPKVIYAPSYQASSIENFALCEYLASHGFVVIAGPSRGTENRWFSQNNAKEMETQARDAEFLMAEAGKYAFNDHDKIALMGFSFGGLANIIVQNRNDNVKAVISLDGTERYQYDLLNESPFFNPQKIDVPYMHFAQKAIPETVLREDMLDASINTRFQLFDSIENSNAYRLRLHNLTHYQFSTLGVLFGERDPRQDRSDAEVMESYKLAATFALNFLKANLNQDKAAQASLREALDGNTPQELLSATSKYQKKVEFTFLDFNDIASNRHYENLQQLYDSAKLAHPTFIIPEAHLNTLGLQLVFKPNSSEQGIAVLVLASRLYPTSANIFDSLAEAYLFVGDLENAQTNFEKSLTLNPNNENAIARLKQLK